MACKLCEASDDSNKGFCPECAERLEHNIGVQCQFCGGFDFIPKSVDTIYKLNAVLGQSLADMMYVNSYVIIPTDQCGDCSVFTKTGEEIVH